MMPSRTFQNGRVLIVDDEPANVRLLEMILRQADFTDVRSTTDPHEVRSIFAEFEPDILLLDLQMPGLTGFEVMVQMRDLIPASTYLPILVLTANDLPLIKQQALIYGAKDFLTKPFDVTEVLLRIKNLLETRFLHLQLQNQNHVLEDKVQERTRNLEEARMEVLQRLSLAAEFRDDQTGQHTQRVGGTSALLARALGMSDEEVQLVRWAATLHDVGKIGIADGILLKQGKLDPDEFRIMTTHTKIGGRILSGSQSPLLQMAEQIALTHHECWDGRGYPDGLQGKSIPLVGRVVSVADVFDALTHCRPYKKAWPTNEAADEIERLSGSKFDPALAGEFLKLFREGIIQKEVARNEQTSATRGEWLPGSNFA